MKTLFKSGCIVVGIVICTVLLYVGWLWLTYIDDTIVSGEGYGLKIGETKIQVFDRAANSFQDEKIFILYPIDKRGYGPHRKFEFTSAGYQLIKDRNMWKFYYSDGFFDSLKLTFRDEHLIEIHRHRKKFELP